MNFDKGYADPELECIGVIEFTHYQLNFRLPKWEAKTRHGISFVPALLNTLEEDLLQQPVYEDIPKYTPSDFNLKIELATPFTPN
ncbi:uncharacterized protein TNCV_4777981 [Trichonephila clavipes]|nr:uncharacterized protein TNCV_4777981 [Trichonephila clavipes]